MSDRKVHDVAVIGCGLMGSAIARALARHGYSVAAWNRTHARAEALAGDGVSPIRSIDEAVRSARLVIACTTTYDSSRSALEPVTEWDGTTLLSLDSGSPDDAEAMGRWAAERDAAYLDGFIMSYPRDIGEPNGMIIGAGPSSLWATHEKTILSLGGASYHVSEQVAAAQVLATGIAGAFYIPALGAYVEAVTYTHSEGVSAEAMRKMTLQGIEMLRRDVLEAAEAIESGEHDTDQATVEIFAAGLRRSVGALQSAGHRAQLIGATLANLEAAESAGLGKLGFYAQSAVLRDADAARTE